jgi:hypothetical protein
MVKFTPLAPYRRITIIKWASTQQEISISPETDMDIDDNIGSTNAGITAGRRWAAMSAKTNPTMYELQ